MAAGDTQITIAGNLVDDPELRYTPTGQAVAKWFQGHYDFVLGFAWIPWAVATLIVATRTGRGRHIVAMQITNGRGQQSLCRLLHRREVRQQQREALSVVQPEIKDRALDNLLKQRQ